MNTKLMHYVNDETQSSDSATWRETLPSQGALHSIVLKAQCTNGATGGLDVNMFDVIDEIEVIGDGSEVLFSLYPEELEKWYETLQGKALTMVEKQAADGVQEIVLPIMFGRKLFDPGMWLPLARFNKVSLEVTFSPNIAADGGFATGTVTFDVMLLITQNDAQLNYEGTLVSRRINSYTTAASGDEEIELPSNSLIRAVGNYVYEAGVADGANVTAITLEDKSTGEKLQDYDWDDFIHVNRELFGAEIVHKAELLATDDDTYASRIGEILNISLEMEETPDTTADEVDILHVDGIAGDTLTLDVTNVDISSGSETMTSSSTDRAIRAAVSGKSPSYFGLFPFLFQDEPGFYLDTGQYGKLVVKQTNGNAGATAYVSIQEARRF